MRIRGAIAVLAAAASALGACADIAGLDELVKDDCADGCADAALLDGSELDSASDSPTPDAAVVHSPDASAHDAETVDASPAADAALVDADDVDAPPLDATAADATALDATALDATPADATAVDAAPPDASAPDATSPDSSAPDTGGPCGTVYLSEPFSDNSRGWTLDTTWGIGATCAAPPAPQKGFPDPTTDHTASTTDNGVGGAFLCGNNPASTTNAARYLTSPVVDTAGAATLKLTFYRWLNSDSATYMASTVDVYDGTAWVNLYTNPTASGTYVTDSAWSSVTYDLSAYANASMRVRFGYSVLSSNVYEMSSWNVDDVTISTLACP